MISNSELAKALIDLGGTVVTIALFLIFAYLVFKRFYPLAEDFFSQFIASQQDIARAMGKQAESMANVNDTVSQFVAKDSNEHREILLGIQVIGQELKTLVEGVTRLKQ